MFFKHGPRGFDGPFGEMGFGRGRFRGGTRGGRARGEIKYEILETLVDGPRHGYDIMLAIEAKTGLRPSPGSIYPALQMLEDGDYVTGAERNGKRTYTITDQGRALLTERSSADGASVPGDESVYDVIAEAMRHVHGIKEAAKQIARTGDITTYRKAVEVLDRARRELFAILADHI